MITWLPNSTALLNRALAPRCPEGNKRRVRLALDTVILLGNSVL
jgi:hypothetical protein